MPDPETRNAAGPAKDTGGTHEAEGRSPRDPFAGDPCQTEGRSFVQSLGDIKPISDYLRRVGATARNFRRAERLVGVEGYEKPVGRIDIAHDGTVTVSGDIEEPSEFEQRAILEAFKAVQFPRITTLTAIPEPPPGVRLSDPSVFPCYNSEGEFVMLHQRYETPTGKGFIPWTRWSDGQWRKMEPETLPFFGLPETRNKATLFIHEGATGADRMRRMIEGDLPWSEFPWRAEVEHAAHIGWLGGVYAVSKSDWRALAGQGWSRVIIVSDNDEKGLNAAKRIAREFGSNTWILAFDNRFDEGFDLGDPFPEVLFDEEGVYIGPSLKECLIPATWATRKLPAGGRGAPTFVLSDAFAPMVAYTVEPPRIILRNNPSRDFRLDAFNMMIRPVSDVKDTAAKVHARVECQHDRLLYRPGEKSGTLNVDGSRGFNVYEGGVSPSPGDPGPWLDYLEHVFPEESDRKLAMRWLATLIAKPSIRMKYGMLLISTTQGVGKSTLGHALRLVLGARNVSFPSEGSLVDSDFNSWLARKRLIFVNEFYSGKSRRAYDKLKPLVTEDHVEINEKGVPQYELENWAHFILCSNSDAALHLDGEDRRYLVPTVSEGKRDKVWWDRLYRWLNAEGPGVIARWADEYVRKHGWVAAGEHAPDTHRKRAIVESSRSEGQQFAIQLGEHLTSLDRQVILRTRDVRAWIAQQRGFRDTSDSRLEKPDTILRAIKTVPGVTVWANAMRPKFGATRDSVVMNFSPRPGVKWAEIKDRLTDIQGVSADEPF
ncbi:DUF5906 domain-containing protein [Qipengyuania nanhaisediminis]|uniref:primase-helicase family protein n=1 Tax=Qipengyuania nanhaisediminis TaxID=604088 RepID=UPI0038B245AD